MAKVNGTDFAIFRTSDQQIIGHSKSCSLIVGADLPESTTKNSNGFQEVIAGIRNAQLSGAGLIRYGDPLNYEELADYVLTKTKVDFYVATGTGYAFKGDGFISNASETGAYEAVAEFEVEIEIQSLFMIIDPNTGSNIWSLNSYGIWDNANLNWQNA